MFKVGDIVEIVQSEWTMSGSTADMLEGTTAEITDVFCQKAYIRENRYYYHINFLNIVHKDGPLPDLVAAEKAHWRDRNFRLIQEYKPITSINDKDVIGLFERNDRTW